MMQISVVYAETERQHWLPVQVHEGCSVEEAIRRSGILERYPQIDLSRQKVGVFGKLTTLGAALNRGDRVEIYRPIIADPKTVKRRPQEA